MTLVKVNPHDLAAHKHFNHPMHGFNRLFDEQCSGTENCAWSPRTDIVETDADHQLILELPGLEKTDISIKSEDRILMITGDMQRPEESENLRYRRQERHSGEFTRRFRLPVGIDADSISAEFKNGLLTVTLPKSEASLGREIEVK
jgi:HSP20 family protein